MRSKRATMLLIGALIGASLVVGAAPAGAETCPYPVCEVVRPPYDYPWG